MRYFESRAIGTNYMLVKSSVCIQNLHCGGMVLNLLVYCQNVQILTMFLRCVAASEEDVCTLPSPSSRTRKAHYAPQSCTDAEELRNQHKKTPTKPKPNKTKNPHKIPRNFFLGLATTIAMWHTKES